MRAALLLALAAALAAPAPGRGAPSVPAPAAAPEPPAATPHGFQARAEKAEVRLGEPFRYELEIRHDPGETYALPEKLALVPFRAFDPACRRAERAGKDGEAITTCAMRLALYDLGPHDVPEIRLAVRTAAGPRVLAVPGPRITGVGMIDPQAPTSALSLRDPAGPVPLLVRSLRLLWWTLGVLGALALAVGAVIAWRRRARAGAEPPAPLPPHERFARRLEALAAERLVARGAGREHVARLSEIVREYLAAVTGQNVLDLTTPELVERLALAGDPRLDLPALRAFLDGADLVKFARAEPDAATCASADGFARDLLARTAPPPPGLERAP